MNMKKVFDAFIIREHNRPFKGLVAKRKDRAAPCPIERRKEEVRTSLLVLFEEFVGNGPVGQFRNVVFLRQVTEEDVAQPGVEILREQLGARLVALMPCRRKNTFLEVGRIRAIKETMLIVIGFDNKVVGLTDSLFDFGVGFSAIGNKDKTLSASTDFVTEAVGRVVIDTEGGNLHIVEDKRLPFIEEPFGGAQFFVQPIVAVNTFVYSRRGIDGNMRPLSERSDGSDMVSVVMRDENPEDIIEIEFQHPQVAVNSSRRNSRVDKNTFALCP